MWKKPLLAVGAVVLISVGLVLVWKMQGLAMRGEFVEALRNGDIYGPHRDLLGKTWSEDELAGAQVLRVPDVSTRHRAVERSVHELGRVEVPSAQYAYQGTVCDTATNIVHVFGRTRTSPHRWCWIAISRVSAAQQLERRRQQVEEMKLRAK